MLMLMLTLMRAAARPAGRASMAGSDLGRMLCATRCMYYYDGAVVASSVS